MTQPCPSVHIVPLALSTDLERPVRDWSVPPSWAAFRVTATLRNFCLWMADWLAPPPVLLAEKATGFAQSQVQQL